MRRVLLAISTLIGLVATFLLTLSYIAEPHWDLYVRPQRAIGLSVFNGRMLVASWWLTGVPDWESYVKRQPFYTGCTGPDEFEAEQYHRLQSNPTGADASVRRWQSVFYFMWRPIPIGNFQLVRNSLSVVPEGRAAMITGIPTSADPRVAVGSTAVILMPIWPAAALLLAWPLMWLFARVRGAHWQRQGRCRFCGFDLRGCTSATCTECGALDDRFREPKSGSAQSEGKRGRRLFMQFAMAALACTGTVAVFALPASMVTDQTWERCPGTNRAYCFGLLPGRFVACGLDCVGPDDWRLLYGFRPVTRFIAAHEDEMFALNQPMISKSYEWLIRRYFMEQAIGEPPPHVRWSSGTYGANVEVGEASVPFDVKHTIAVVPLWLLPWPLLAWPVWVWFVRPWRRERLRLRAALPGVVAAGAT